MKKSLLAVLFLASSAGTWAQGLKDAYKDYCTIGVAVNQRNVTNTDQQALIIGNFNSVTAENDMKPQPTEPRQGQFNFNNADRIANFCRQNGIKMRGHCLMWHAQIGEWMYKDDQGNLLPKEEFFRRMRDQRRRRHQQNIGMAQQLRRLRHGDIPRLAPVLELKNIEMMAGLPKALCKILPSVILRYVRWTFRS
jgi:hypothetical protein